MTREYPAKKFKVGDFVRCRYWGWHGLPEVPGEVLRVEWSTTFGTWSYLISWPPSCWPGNVLPKHPHGGRTYICESELTPAR